MADYYPLLSRAVRALNDQSPEMRQAVYDRARAALIDQLRSLDPPLSEGEIERERRSLEETIRRVEADHPRPDGEVDGAPVLDPETRTAPEARALTEAQALSEAQVSSEAQDSPEGRAHPGAKAPEVTVGERPVPHGGARTAGARPAEMRRPERRRQPSPASPSGEVGGEEAGATVEPSARGRPRIETAPPGLGRGGQGRTLIFAAVIGGAIAAIAVAAWTLRDKPVEAPASPTVAAPAEPPQGDAKIAGRVGSERAPSAPGPQSSAAQPAASRAEVPVAQRAVLYEENPSNPQVPKATAGRALWRLETANAGQGQPLETLVRANVEVPGAGLTLALTIRRNTDPTLPNSHTVEMVFTTPAGDPNRVVREIGPLQLKPEEAVRGTQLAGPAARAGDNLFLMLLSNLDADVRRNTDLLLTRNWIDLPVRFASGQRAILTFEKGISGEQVLQDAFRQWQR